MRIGELSKRAGVSVDTLRYYERIGLLPRAPRDGSGQRSYDDSILVWLEFLRRMKTAGMPIREMLRYAALRERGPETEPERRALLEAHRERVRRRLAELQDCLVVLDTKIAGYAGPDTRMEDYDASLPRRRRDPARPRPPAAG